MKIQKTTLKMPKIKYSLGESVLVYTKNGLVETNIRKIDVSFSVDETIVWYWVDANSEIYYEEQITEKQKGLERLIQNAKQLQLNFLPQ